MPISTRSPTAPPACPRCLDQPDHGRHQWHPGLIAGVHSVEVTVSDSTLTDTDSFTWTVTNTNQAPVFTTDITDQTDAEGGVGV